MLGVLGPETIVHDIVLKMCGIDSILCILGVYAVAMYEDVHDLYFFGLCAEMRVNGPETMKYFCVSEAIALYIQKYVQYRKRKVFYGDSGKIEGLVPVMVKHKTEKYFVPLSSVHNDEISQLLEANKLQFTEAVMYRTVSHIFEAGELDGYDMMIFFSPAGIESLKQNDPNFEQGDTVMGCFGATTAKAIKDAGFRLDIEAPVEGVTSMPAAINLYLSKNN